MGGQKIKENKCCPNDLKKKVDKHIIHLSSHNHQNLSIFTNKKVLFLKKIFGMLVFMTLKNEKSDFLNSDWY